MKIGFVAGNFDCIHPGYIHMFNKMEEECDEVWILLQTDPTVERPEKCKPVLSEDERIEILMSLTQITAVMTYTLESELYNILKTFVPRKEDDDIIEYVRFLGDDYIGKSFTGDDLNIPIRYLNRDHGWSTTKYKQLIANSIK